MTIEDIKIIQGHLDQLPIPKRQEFIMYVSPHWYKKAIESGEECFSVRDGELYFYATKVKEYKAFV